MYAVSNRDCSRIILRSSSNPLTYVFMQKSLDTHDSSLTLCNSFIGSSFFEAKWGFIFFLSTLCLLRNKVSLAIESRNFCPFFKPLAVALKSCTQVNSAQNSLSDTEHRLEEQSFQSKDLNGQKLRIEHNSSLVLICPCVAESGEEDAYLFRVSDWWYLSFQNNFYLIKARTLFHWASWAAGRKYRSCLQALKTWS